MSWPMVSLGSVSDKIDYGLTASAIEKKNGPKFLRITDLQDNNVNWKSVPSCECSQKEHDKYRLKSGDIVFARTGATTGKSYLLNDLKEDAVFASYLIRVRPNAEVDSLYLSYFFKSPSYWHQISLMSEGAAQPGVNSTKLKELVFPMPPLQEQKRIAAILDKADAIRRKRQQAIELADEFLRSVFLDMFGDPVVNPKGWEVVGIDKVCSDIVDCVNRTAKTVDYETPYKMIRTTNVRNYKVDLENVRYVAEDVYTKWTRRLTPQRGDIIFTREAPAGEAGLIESDDLAFLGQRTMHFRPDLSVIDSSFLLHELMGASIKDQIRRLSSGSTVVHLSVPECKKFQVRTPPLELQKRFGEVRKNVLSMLNKFNSAAIDQEQAFKSLSQKAFSGDL